jgi:hypothetical protein
MFLKTTIHELISSLLGAHDAPRAAVSRRCRRRLHAEHLESRLPLTCTGFQFCDEFENSNPLLNGDVGGNWTDQSKTAAAVLSESASEMHVSQPSLASWAIGKVRSDDGFNWGSTATFVLNASQGADRGSGMFDQTGTGVGLFGWSQISLADSANTMAGFGGFNNGGLAALTIDIGTGFNGGGTASAFSAYVPGSSGQGSTTGLGNAVFDSLISPSEPLITTIATSASGDLTISFNKTYNNGSTVPITGSALGGLGSALGSSFDVAIGAQGGSSNTASSHWDRVTVYETPVVISQSVGQTIVNENDSTYNVDTYTVVLDSQPADNVTITASPNNSEIELNDGGAGNPLELTFTPSTWAEEQTVTVKAVADVTLKEGVHSSTITHTSSSADSLFHDLAVDDLFVTVVDAANAYYRPGFGVYAKTDFTDYSLEKATHFATGSTEYSTDGTVFPAPQGTEALIDRVHRFGVKIFVNFSNEVLPDGPPISLFDQVTDNADGSRDNFVNNIQQHVIDNGYDGVWLNIEWSSLVPPWVGHNQIMVELDNALGNAYEIHSDVFINRGELDGIGLPHVDALTMMAYNGFGEMSSFHSYWNNRGASNSQLAVGMATGWNEFGLDPDDAYNRTVYAINNGMKGVFLFGFDSENDATSMLRGVRDALFDNPPIAGIAGDLNNNFLLDAGDIDLLYARIAAGGVPYDISYDLKHDGVIGQLDVDELVLVLMGKLYGDLTLNGSVNGNDFNHWNSHRFQTNTGWGGGDFNGDGVTDVRDFNIWNANKYSLPALSGGLAEPAGQSEPRAAGSGGVATSLTGQDLVGLQRVDSTILNFFQQEPRPHPIGDILKSSITSIHRGETDQLAPRWNLHAKSPRSPGADRGTLGHLTAIDEHAKDNAGVIRNVHATVMVQHLIIHTGQRDEFLEIWAQLIEQL